MFIQVEKPKQTSHFTVLTHYVLLSYTNKHMLTATKLFRKSVIIATTTAISLSLAPVALAAPTLQVIGPNENQKIESDKVTVSWKLDGVTLTDFQTYPKIKSGQGHLHLWLDEASPSPANATKVTTGSTYTFNNVKTGSHTLIVELVNNDHTSFKPPIKKTVKFESLSPIYVNPQLPQNDLTLFLILVAIVLIGGLWYFLSPEPTPVKSTSTESKKKKKS